MCFSLKREEQMHHICSSSFLTGIALVTTIRPPAPSRFDAGSFLGGMMLALILTLAIALGYKLACTKQDVRYRTL